MYNQVSIGLLLLLVVPCVFSSPLHDIISRNKRQIVADNECNQADIVFVLDSSGSIKRENWLKVLNFTKTVVESLDIGPYDIRVGCITYGTKATPNFYLDTYDNKQAILDAIDLIPWKDQETNTSGALWFMKEKLFSFEKGDRPRAPNLAIVMTDGESNRDQHLTIPIAEEVKAEGRITMFAIGVGNKTNANELRAIATNSSYIFNVSAFNMLPQINSQIVSAACDIPVECHQNADIAFVLDSSGSVRAENFEKMKEFVASLVDMINVEANQSNVGLINFGTDAQIEFLLNAYQSRSDIKKAVMGVKYLRGTTNSAAALRLAREQMFQPGKGDRSDMKNIIFFFTDGNSNDFAKTIEEAQKARKAGITIIAIAVTTWIQMDEIREMASDPDDLNVYQVKNFQEIGRVTKNLKAILCDQINECDSKPCKNGGVCVNGINKYECICPTGTAGVNCEITCSPVDVVMAVDSSGSIGRNNYYTVLDFAKGFANSLNFQPGNTQMGLEIFSTNNNIKFQLNTHRNKQDTINAISFPYSGGTTNTASALQAMRDVMFTSSNGNRGGVRKVGITVTDGESNDRAQTYQQATMNRDSGITMLSVAINIKNKRGQEELMGIASDPDDKNVMNVENFATLRNITESLLMAVCNTNNECQPNPCHSSAECVDLVNGYKCVCPRGRAGKHCERTCDGQADIAFVVDSSGSIRETRFQIVRDYVKSIVNELEIAQDKVRVSLMQFSDDAKVLFHLNKYSRKEDVLQNIEWMPYTRGRTYTADALKKLYTEVFVSNNGDRFDVPNYAILITDGESTVKPEDTLPEAIQARVNGIHLIVVAVGDRRNSLEIKGIASDPDNFNIYSVENFNQLATKSMPLVNGMCDTLDECLSNPCQNGGTCGNGLGQYVCRCRDEYTGQNCERQCTTRSDIAFILDASGSVEKNFALAMNLTRRIVKGLNFAGDRTRVGVLTYSDNSQIRFNLNTYGSLIGVENAIAFTLMGGRTNTYSGLNEMRRNMFTPVNGDRSGVTNYGVVITDGRSNVLEDRTVPEANTARTQDQITLFAVGIGENGKVDRGEINGIANNPDSDYAYFMQTENDLEPIAQKILDVICK